MKTNEEIAEMAEREYKSIDKPIRSGKDMLSYILGFEEGYQAAQEGMKWIDCKDRLPEKGLDVLVLRHDNEICMAWHDEKTWRGVDWGTYSHWQPLPQKPLIP